MKKFVILTSCLLIVAVLVALGSTLLSKKETLSGEQLKVISVLGFPDVFMLMMENDDRTEIWTYFKTGVNCIFANGKFAGYEEQKPLSGKFFYPRLKPTQFPKGMSERDVLRILPGPSVISDGTIESIDGTVRIFDYFDQVKVGMVDGKVVYVQTLPLALEAEGQL